MVLSFIIYCFQVFPWILFLNKFWFIMFSVLNRDTSWLILSNWANLMMILCNRGDVKWLIIECLLIELSIRGDFRTTVEYLITLLETDDFQQNNISTTWLDARVAQRFKSEKPDSLLAVICGSLHVADQAILNSFQYFQASLERGQVLPAYTLANSIEVELIYEGLKYKCEFHW